MGSSSWLVSLEEEFEEEEEEAASSLLLPIPMPLPSGGRPAGQGNIE